MNSFLQGKKTLSIPPLKAVPGGIRPANTPGVAARPATPAPATHGQPTVEVIKEGDKVVRLVVVCGCGERVEIECLYPAGS